MQKTVISQNYHSTPLFLFQVGVTCLKMQFPGGSDDKKSTHSAENLGSVPGLGRYPGEGNGYSPQYSYLGNSRDRGAWQATVHGVTELDTTEHYSVLRPEIGMVSQLLADPLHLLWVL